MVKQVATKDEFDATLKDNKLVVVDFTATWCGPCQQIAPKFAELAEKYSDVTFIKVDVDDNGDTAEACDVQCMPTFQFFKEGSQVHKIEGASVDKLVAAIEDLKK
ncbi:unnamed protein product [Amoebophrya sp. A25]|nr:unnamed protein product [Amoebophrya sp. A25]|eukprot:GSA25T00021796001.1